MKEQNKILKYINDYLKITSGLDRLFFFTLIFMLLTHIATCLWIVVAAMNSQGQSHEINRMEGTWLEPWYEVYGNDENGIYAISFYWCITTITTVGYGDISATNTTEMWFCSLMMIIGVVSFSFANGTLTSII